MLFEIYIIRKEYDQKSTLLCISILLWLFALFIAHNLL